jgi:TonB family protein
LGNSVYEIPLSDGGWADASAALSAVKGNATVKSRGHVERRGAGEWQHLHVVADGPDVSITLNGSVVAVFEVADLIGHILFRTRTGAIQLRNIVIEPRGSIARPGADGVSWPKLLRDVKPSYTADAMKRRVQGIVEVEGLILTDGSVGAVQVMKSLDPELDQAAVAAVWQWKFAPATRDGVPVPVLVPIEVSFSLRK